MKRTVAHVIAATISAFIVVEAQAQSQIAIGTLTCTGGAGVGLILGSQKSYDCKFSPSNGGAAEAYRATVTKIGLDVGVTGQSVIVWTVLAPKQELNDRALAGNYVGATADAAIGAGGGAKILVGGSTESIALQPLSVQGQTGINLAVGVAGMTLR